MLRRQSLCSEAQLTLAMVMPGTFSHFATATELGLHGTSMQQSFFSAAQPRLEMPMPNTNSRNVTLMASALREMQRRQVLSSAA